MIKPNYEEDHQADPIFSKVCVEPRLEKKSITVPNSDCWLGREAEHAAIRHYVLAWKAKSFPQKVLYCIGCLAHSIFLQKATTGSSERIDVSMFSFPISILAEY